MDELEQLTELTTIGERLGYTGTDLQTFVQDERKKLEDKSKEDMDRAERRALREEARELAQRQENEAARKHEADMMQLRKELGETPRPPASDLGYSAPKIPPFEEQRDSMDSYLERYERHAKAHKWDEADWAVRLSAHLKGKSLEVYSRLPVADANDYDKLKLALLRYYQMTEEGYKVKFRTSRPGKSEDPEQFMTRLKEYFDNWVKMSKTDKTYKSLRDLMIREQFLICCAKDVNVFLRERKCTTEEKLTEEAQNFYQAHGFFQCEPR